MLKILSKNEFILNKDKIGLSLVPYYNNTSGNEEMIVNKQNIYRDEELKILLAKETYQEIYNIAMGTYRDWETDRKSTRLNSSHSAKSRMPSSA